MSMSLPNDMRKYGRRGAKRNTDGSVHDSNIQSDSTTRARKRQKIVVEVVARDPTSPSLSRGNNASSSNDNDQAPSVRTAFRRHVPTRHTTPVACEPSTSQFASASNTTPRKSKPNLESYTSLTHSQLTPSLAVSGDELDSRTSTPRKPAKNLSQLFNISPSPRKLFKHDGVAKRMLTRSRTEPSADSENATTGSSLSAVSSSLVPTETTPRRAYPTRALTSTQSTPSAKERLIDFASHSPPTTPTHQSIVTPHTRTYGGKSRSFLMTLPTTQLGDSSCLHEMHENVEDEFEIRESYTDLRTRWGVDNSEDDPRMPSPTISSPGKRKAPKAALPTAPDGMMNDLKSITELRSKGETRRFLDEVDYLFEGLDPKGGIGLRRASALEIVTKLCDIDFARKAKAADFLGRSWVVLREAGAGSGDKILDVILVFFAALVARDSQSLAELAEKSDLIDTLFSMLLSTSPEKDFLSLLSAGANDAELKKAGIVSKIERGLLMGLWNIISTKSGLFSETIAISIRLLASRALVVLEPNLLHLQYLSALHSCLRRELCLIPPRVVGYIAGLSLLPALSPHSHSDWPSFEHLQNCLKLLDTFLSGQWSNTGGHDLPFLNQLESDCEALADGLVALCVAADILVNDTQPVHLRKTAYRCLEVTFRILASLTHGNECWCRALVHHDFALPLIMRTMSRFQENVNDISYEDTVKSEEDDTQAWDLTCLALGLLTNMIQVNDEARDLSQELRINPICPAGRDCLRGCRCIHRIGGLEFLALIYVQQDTAHEVTDLGVDFLRGHLAVLFGLLMQRNDRHREALLHVLPGESDYIKVDLLVNQAREFVTFYSDLTAHLADAATKISMDPEMSLRTGNGIGSICKIIKEGRGEDVAHDVILYLERLKGHHSNP